MAEALFALGPESKRMLEKSDGREVSLERQPPKQLEHFAGINDLRIAAERSGLLRYFFAYWELPGIGWRHDLIPDAVLSLGGRAFAIEFDRGLEGIRYFVRSKIARYSRGLPGLPLSAVLVVADRGVRMQALVRAVPDPHGFFLFTTLDLVRKHGLLGPVFQQEPGGKGESLV